MTSKNQRKSYRSNAKARDWLLKNGYNDILMYGHHKKKRGGGMVWMWQASGKQYLKRVNDAYNLFDGQCFDEHGDIMFFQVKSNNWPVSKNIISWMKGKNTRCMAINVRDKGPIVIRVFVRSITNDAPDITVLQIPMNLKEYMPPRFKASHINVKDKERV